MTRPKEIFDELDEMRKSYHHKRHKLKSELRGEQEKCKHKWPREDSGLGNESWGQVCSRCGAVR